MQILKGVVVSGVGSFGYWIEKLYLHYKRKTGLDLYPGTLNIQLDTPYRLPKDCLRVEADEYGGSVSVNLVQCSIYDRKAFILRTDANEQGTGHHPHTIIEVATDVKLRDVYQLKDGDEVEVRLP